MLAAHTPTILLTISIRTNTTETEQSTHPHTRTTTAQIIAYRAITTSTDVEHLLATHIQPTLQATPTTTHITPQQRTIIRIQQRLITTTTIVTTGITTATATHSIIIANNNAYRKRPVQETGLFLCFQRV